MTTISGNKITITKGDTLVLKINMYQDNEEYDVQDGDVIRFALKKAYSDDECIILKEIPHETMTLVVDSAEMKKLDVVREGYVYDVQLTDQYGIVDTFISGKLYTTEEVE